jgi:DNA-binding NtrC family response regulator
MESNGPRTEDNRLDDLVGVSAWADRIRDDIRRVGPSDYNVLITGPTGTGKELIARALHAQSPRARRPFIAVDCAAVSGPLFTGHLFGHIRGAFTGATHPALGCFRAADGGTVLLDEIGELESEHQSKLLRLLQERSVTPLGSYESTPVDVRVIAATNRDLEQMVSEGTFREDLYYRLNVVSLQTSPLCERPEDIAPLAIHFLTRLASRMKAPPKQLSPACLECLRRQSWPGNARQLENFLTRAMLMSEGDTIHAGSISDAPSPVCPAIEPVSRATDQRPSLPVIPGKPLKSANPSAESYWPTMAEVEREHIRRTLEHTNFNQSATASLLQMHRQRLVRKIRAHRLPVPAFHRGRPKRNGEAGA